MWPGEPPGVALLLYWVLLVQLGGAQAEAAALFALQSCLEAVEKPLSPCLRVSEEAAGRWKSFARFEGQRAAPAGFCVAVCRQRCIKGISCSQHGACSIFRKGMSGGTTAEESFAAELGKNAFHTSQDLLENTNRATKQQHGAHLTFWLAPHSLGVELLLGLFRAATEC
jgi:hypothetical protein